MKPISASELLSLAMGEINANRKDAAMVYLDQAEAVLISGTGASSEDINVTLQLCSHYYNTQNHNKALALITKMLDLIPDNLDLQRGKAMILRGMGRSQEAVLILEAIVQGNGWDIASITTLANIYYFSLGNREKAAQYYELGFAVDPNNLELLQSYCAALAAIGGGDNITRAYQLAQKVLGISPSVAPVAEVVQSLALRVLDYDMYEKIADDKSVTELWIKQLNITPFLFRMGRVKTLEDRFDLIKIHRIYGTAMEAVSKLKPISHKVKKRTDNKIRIGILSSDLRNHPVVYFIWPIIKRLDRSKFEIYCYSCYPGAPDAIQSKISQEVNSFRVYSTENSHAIAQSIADDELDILFELGGSTSFGRSDICTYRPAPMQVAWLGYPHSIGFPTAIDYIMVDPYINPKIPGLLIEKPFVMPHTWVVIDPMIFPALAINTIIPEDRNGYITLGTLNAPYKLTPTTFKVWADLMKMIPNSRFLYGRMSADSKALQQNFIKHMHANGIAPERISFAAANVNHLNCYNNIDIALDTFPHTGGTTTCEALWMGVPIVTLVGEAFFERISYSNLSNARLSDLCAFTIDEYKDTVMKLVHDRDRRRDLRHNLRQQILQHPLGQAQQFTEDFAKKIMEILGRR